MINETARIGDGLVGCFKGPPLEVDFPSETQMKQKEAKVEAIIKLLDVSNDGSKSGDNIFSTLCYL